KREAAGRDVLAEEHPHQVVIAAAAAEASRQIRDVNLHDRAGVIRQPTREAEVQTHSTFGTRSRCNSQYGANIFDGITSRRTDRQAIAADIEGSLVFLWIWRGTLNLRSPLKELKHRVGR